MVEKRKEVEVFGVTYDRYMLLQLHTHLTKELGLKKIVEMPSHGAKAAGSLYDIGFAKAGCDVTLVNPEMDMMHGWQTLDIADRATPLENVDVYNTGFKDKEFDLAFNFVTWTELDDPPAFITERFLSSNMSEPTVIPAG